jgi:uncharacterized protein YjbJ (UPF0337 family)
VFVDGVVPFAPRDARPGRLTNPDVIVTLMIAPHGAGTQRREATMDWNRIEGSWMQVKGKAKDNWGKLTDDELDKMNGRRDQLEGAIRERYGYRQKSGEEGCGRLVSCDKMVTTVTVAVKGLARL